MSERGDETGTPVPAAPSRSGLFREDALRHHLGRRDFGDVLRLPPTWTRLAFPLILAFVATVLGYLCLGTVEEYARGSGIVRAEEGGPERFALVAVFPGETRPRLRTGMRVRVELSGYPGRSLWTTIDTLDDRIVGPADARRILGASAEDSLTIDAPVVIAWASLRSIPAATGTNDLTLHDGMVAKLEAPIARERLIYALLPGIRQAFGG